MNKIEDFKIREGGLASSKKEKGRLFAVYLSFESFNIDSEPSQADPEDLRIHGKKVGLEEVAPYPNGVKVYVLAETEEEGKKIAKRAFGKYLGERARKDEEGKRDVIETDKKNYRILFFPISGKAKIINIGRVPIEIECESVSKIEIDEDEREDFGFSSLESDCYATYAVASSETEAVAHAAKVFGEYFQAKAEKFLQFAKAVKEVVAPKKEKLYCAVFHDFPSCVPLLTVLEAQNNERCVPIDKPFENPKDPKELWVYTKASSEEEAGEKARSFFKTMVSEKFQEELKTIDEAQLLRCGDSFEKDEEEEKEE